MIRFILLAALASYLFGCTSAPISSQDEQEAEGEISTVR